MAFRLGRLAYLSRGYDLARTHFEQAAADRPLDPNSHAWLGLTWNRLGERERAWAEAHRALELDSCNVVACDALSAALNPAFGDWERANDDSAWAVALHGVRCDSLDGDLWIKVWIHALERDTTIATRAVRGMRESAVFGNVLYTQARWVLTDLPPRAVLVFNGDSDYIPAVVLQQVEGLRPDVALLNISLLNNDWYRRHARDQLGVPMPFELAFAVTVDSASMPETSQLCGPYSLVAPTFHGSEVDTATLRRSVMRLTRADLAGASSGRGSRSPYQGAAGAGVRGNLAYTITRHYRYCRSVGDDRQAEALRSWALSICQGDEFEFAVPYLRSLPTDWEAERHARR